MKRSMADSIWLFKTFLHNVEKWPNILFKIFTVCWPFFNSMYEKFSCQNISLKLLRKRICGCYFWKIATFLLQQQLGNTSEVATHSCSVKKLVWKNKCYMKTLLADSCNFAKKRESSIGVSMWIFPNVSEHLFFRIVKGYC